MSVSTPDSTATNYSQTRSTCCRSSDGGGDRELRRRAAVERLARRHRRLTSGHYTWSYTLAAGEAAYYTLSGSAIAFAGPGHGRSRARDLRADGARAGRHRRGAPPRAATSRLTRRRPDRPARTTRLAGVFHGALMAVCGEATDVKTPARLATAGVLVQARMGLLAERRQAHRRLDALDDRALELGLTRRARAVLERAACRGPAWSARRGRRRSTGTRPPGGTCRDPDGCPTRRQRATR